MKILLARLTFATISLLAISLPGFAGQLDDYYLSRFGEQPIGSALQKAALFQSADAGEIAQCGTPLKHGLQRDWSKLEAATQKMLAKQLAAPVLSGTESTLLSPSGRFKIHYTTSGADAVPSLSWVQTVAQTFDDVAAAYLARGWNLAPTISAAPYDVYLRELSFQSLYGQTTSGQAAPSDGFSNAYGSFMEIDNNFTDSIYVNAFGGPYSATQSLQITAAHEYHHAIQYGYNFFFDIWFAEATSTWHEDELYDGVNQLYNYIPGWFNNSRLSLDTSTSTKTGGGYGRWIFNRYLAEQHGTDVIRAAWENLATLNSPGSGTDIPMVPVLDSLLSSAYASSLGSDYFGFAKRVYTREWATHTADIPGIHPYSPLASYSVFPVDANTSPAPAVTLPHYSFAYYRFVPSPGSPGDLSITITGTSGILATAFRKIGSTIVEFPFTHVDGATITVPGFSTSSEVVLLITNTTASDNHSANFSTNGTGLPVTEPSGGTVYPPSLPAAPTNTGSGGGGCFIATAAYGSYLHPHVQLLRDFRDRQLLTNAPGRAFVALYYRLSPPLADFIARHGTLRAATRLALTPLILVVVHPAASGTVLLTALGLLYLPLRRRLQERVAVG